jgi:DNA-binding protein HU-beta
MNKTELVAAIAERADISKVDAARVLDATLDVIVEALKPVKAPKGKKKKDEPAPPAPKVTIVGFGTFEVRERQARKGRNPKTKEVIEIPASRTPAFKAGKVFKDAVK